MIKADNHLLHADLTDQIISCAYDVYNKLGFGFSEKVYENAMMVKLSQKNIPSIQQAPINVRFEGQLVGEFCADIFVDSEPLPGLKAGASGILA